VFSTGSVYDPVSNAARWEECRQYWAGIDNIEQHFLAPLLKMYSEEEWLNLLEKQFPLKNYQALLLPPLLDTHYEHRLVHYVGMAMTRVTPASIIEYKSASVLDTWIPNMFVEIGLFENDKVKRLEKFESQRKTYFKLEYMTALHAHVNSLKKRVMVTEQFRIVSFYP
jgi:hypothetical protein